MELLRRAVDAAEEEVAEDLAQGRPAPASFDGIVKISHVSKSIRDAFSSPQMQFLRACSLCEKAVMIALMLEMRASKQAVATVQVCVCVCVCSLQD